MIIAKHQEQSRHPAVESRLRLSNAGAHFSMSQRTRRLLSTDAGKSAGLVGSEESRALTVCIVQARGPPLPKNHMLPKMTLSQGCPTFWCLCATLEEELSWATYYIHCDT